MKYIKHIALLLVAFAGLSACEKEIEIDLNSEDPQLVIEGWVTNQSGPYEISISKSTNYFENEAIPYVSNALVYIQDDMGGADTLTEISPGKYQTTSLQGQIGHTYTMTAIVEGETYTASSYLPRINDIDTTIFQYRPEQIGILEPGYYATAFAQEPQGIGEFYRFRFTRNDSLYNGPFDYFLGDDRLVDGQLAAFQMPYTLELGDTIIVEVQSLTNEAYDFYLTLFQEVTSAGNPFGAPPANLKGNISNNCLGFFGAAGVARDTAVVQ